MTSFLTVALGGAIGASARHVLGLFMLRIFGPSFPVGTLLANVFGGLLMGILMGWLVRENPVGAQSIRCSLASAFWAVSRPSPHFL